MKQVRAKGEEGGEGHQVHRAGRRGIGGGGSGHHARREDAIRDPEGDTDMTSMMHTDRPWRKRPRTEATSFTGILTPRPPTSNTNRRGRNRRQCWRESDEGYHRLRQEMGVAEPEEEHPRCSGFSEARLEAVRGCLAAGGEADYINRVGQFLRILSHMLELHL